MNPKQKLGKRRFTTVVSGQLLNKPRYPISNTGFNIYTCKFCKKIISPGENVIAHCYCEGIFQKVHCHCFTYYIFSLKKQHELQAMCFTCSYSYQYSIKVNKKIHCCSLNSDSKKIYCWLCVMIIFSLWVSIMSYCFSNENIACLIIFVLIFFGCAIVYIIAFFTEMCMEEVRIVVFETYKP